MSQIEFLTIESVLKIHSRTIERFGGAVGIRNQEGLESAVSQPQATFENAFLHKNIFEMAAAYIFHISQNHLFIDGNKRTALAAGLSFLMINGYEIVAKNDHLYKAMMEVASGQLFKSNIALFLEKNTRRIKKSKK